MHADVVQKCERWTTVVSKKDELVDVSLSFVGVTDADLEILIAELRNSEQIEILDLSFNKLQDTGVQSLAGALAQKAFPGLKELRM